MTPGQPTTATGILMAYGEQRHREELREILSRDPLAKRILALEALWSALKDRAGFRLGYNPAVATACDNLSELERDQPATLAQFTSFCGQCGARYARETASQAKASAEQCNHLPPAVFGGGISATILAEHGELMASVEQITGATAPGVFDGKVGSAHGAEQVRQIAASKLSEFWDRVNGQATENPDVNPFAGRDMGDENDSRGAQ